MTQKHQSIIQTKIVLLIALLAVARKFIILDIRETIPGHLLGLSAITQELGMTYWLVAPAVDISIHCRLFQALMSRDGK
jgi:hypothetical protein